MTLDDLSLSEHGFLLEIEFSSSTHTARVLATATLKATLTEGDNMIVYSASDFTFVDDDNDGINNYDALKNEKNPPGSGGLENCVLGTSLLGMCKL